MKFFIVYWVTIVQYFCSMRFGIESFYQKQKDINIFLPILWGNSLQRGFCSKYLLGIWRISSSWDAILPITNITYTEKTMFPFPFTLMGYDCGDSFPLDFEPNRIPFGSKSKGKLSSRSYPIQFDKKLNNSFLSALRKILLYERHF